jgi:hypothetical protein
MATNLSVPSVQGCESVILRANGNWTHSLPKKVQLSDPAVILTEDHGAVTPMLEMLRFNKKIPNGSTLIHFDYHHDIYADEPAMIYRKPRTESEARNTFAYCGNYVLSLIGTGTVRELVWVLPAFRLMMNHAEVSKQQLAMFQRNLVRTKRPHQIADKVSLVNTLSIADHEKEEPIRTFDLKTTLFDACTESFPSPDTPVIIDIDMDWFGVKSPTVHGFKDFPLDIVKQLISKIAYFRNVQAICIAKESKNFALHTNKEAVMLRQFIDNGVIKLA